MATLLLRASASSTVRLPPEMEKEPGDGTRKLVRAASFMLPAWSSKLSSTKSTWITPGRSTDSELADSLNPYLPLPRSSGSAR